MLECYVCGCKTRKQYFDFANGIFILKDRCFNPLCKAYNKWLN